MREPNLSRFEPPTEKFAVQYTLAHRLLPSVREMEGVEAEQANAARS